jgi:hypothetical protein
VAAQLGYCGLDRGRQPLVGDEIRSCWEAWPPGANATTLVPLTIRPAAGSADVAAHREFVEVTDRAPDPSTAAEAGPPVALDASAPVALDVSAPVRPPAEPGWSLWADLEG